MDFYKTLIPFDIFLNDEPIKLDLVYKNADHPRNIFKTALYHQNAQCWAQKETAAVTILAARLLKKQHNWSLQIKDCLRTSEAQAAMQETDIVKANPHWQVSPNRLLAPPGKGAHPRAMAVDVCALYSDGSQINMGTPFDWIEPDSARSYTDFHQDILDNRQKLEKAFVESARILKQDFIPYPDEWWDYRFTQDIYNQYEAQEDKNLPPQMQMTNQIDNNIENLPLSHFETLAEEIMTLLHNADENL